ncbi:Similar to KLHL10: Kelch-like protein 10 (Homo sapiens) [Cotesia congregata]|uniref:Kelch-like protein diablo n=1 Tax=Cotesia congregata TaxID=51543 RepID=A0A8J2MXT1_COTCN|nr:Similar to KLHL10: Kelch-like protein 10 (Homo sapiens) [Cotesia congregata]
MPNYLGHRQQIKRKQSDKKKCVCLPIDYRLIEFPAVWSELRAMNQLCDGKIICAKEEIFPIHRAILSAVSPYFKALFTKSWKGNSGETQEVTINWIPGELFSLILDYAYKGTCKVTVENVEQLLPVADQFEVLGVVQLCCQFLLQELSPENCLGVYKYARSYFCHDLEEKARKYIRHNFKKIWRESTEFKELTCGELCKILSDDELNVKSEELVFEAIKSWVEVDESNRAGYLPDLVECIRFGLINSKIISKPSNRTSEKYSRPRIPYEILFAVGGWSGGSPTSFIETYDTRADRWFLSVNTDVVPRAYHGSTGRIRLSSGERYEPERNQWEMIPPMHKQRSDASAAALENKIYIVGGFNGEDIYRSAEAFDVETSQWSYIKSMINPRTGVSLVAFRDSLYAFGGYSGLTRLTSAEKFNPNQPDEWQEVTQMLRARSNFATVILDDMIFVIGGYDGYTTIADVECYDPETNEWYDASSMNLNRSALSACVIPGLSNAKDYSYLSKTKNFGQGQAGAKNHGKPDQSGEGPHIELGNKITGSVAGSQSHRY